MQESRLFWKNDGRAVPSVRLHLRWRLVHAQQHGDGVGLLGAGGKPADVLGQQRQLLSQGDFGKLLPLEENQQTEVGVQGLLVVQVLHLCREEAFFRNTKAGGVKLPFVKRRMVLRGKTGRSAGKNGTCRGKTCLSGEKNTLSRREWSAIITLL